MLRSKLIPVMLCISLLLSHSLLQAQAPTWTVDPFGKEKKPDQYEDKILPSEKTGDKKFGPVRKAIQNTTSHYNFYYNANNKLNAVIERAKMSNKDDYSRLLTFYPYSLDATAAQKVELDSVIFKATAGILLHDLRTEWVDNFYLLIGESYFLKKDFDSAALTFQFINYNLYPRKKGDDDYDRMVGSNDAASGKGSVSIADKEKRNIIKKIFTLPPSRNDALIWQIRTFTQQGAYGDAAGLISILGNDPNLPHRLKNDLEEVSAYWFYAQNNYDSSAAHLEKALSNADTKEDKSRWEYLLAQMYEIGGRYDDASKYYVRAAKHTNDPIMDIYARLSDAKMMRNSGNYKELDNSIANLVRMAHKDRYEPYRDIIYYSTAQLSLQKPDTSNGIVYYNKSISYHIPSSVYKDKSFLQLANISYTQRRYKDARSFYDSLTITGKETDFDPKAIAERKEVLGRLIPKILAVEREDSLQRLALMLPADRDAFIKKMQKRYAKANGVSEDDDAFAGNTLITFNDRTAAPDIFPNNGSSTGVWYFYNASLRSKGFNDFKSQWGKRSNVDNWRRRTASEAAIGKNLNGNIDIDATIPQDGKGLIINQKDKINEYSYENMVKNIPTTKEQMDSSNNSVAKNLFGAAEIFQNELDDYPQALVTWEDYVRRFPQDARLADVYYNMAFCYSKMGDIAKADYYRNLVKTSYAGSNAAKAISNPASLKPNQKNPEITGKYQDIYNMFIEGNFDLALAAKKKADSTYGTNYWSPQLLYIESVYYIKERKDSNAIASLKDLQRLYPKSGLKDKAATMIEVLGRRAQIEKYLTDLQVTRAADDQIIIADDKAAPVVTAPVKQGEIKTVVPAITTTKVISDSIKAPAVYTNKSFTLNPAAPQYVVMILDKVDPVYVNEAKNAFTRFNKESMETINLSIAKDTLDPTKSLLIFTTFYNSGQALKYFDRIRKAAPSEVSWLQPAKYSFIIISDDNLKLLKTNKDLTSYRQLLNANFGNKF